MAASMWISSVIERYPELSSEQLDMFETTQGHLAIDRMFHSAAADKQIYQQRPQHFSPKKLPQERDPKQTTETSHFFKDRDSRFVVVILIADFQKTIKYIPRGL